MSKWYVVICDHCGDITRQGCPFPERPECDHRNASVFTVVPEADLTAARERITELLANHDRKRAEHQEEVEELTARAEAAEARERELREALKLIAEATQRDHASASWMIDVASEGLAAAAEDAQLADAPEGSA